MKITQTIYKTLKFMFLDFKIPYHSHFLIFPPFLQKKVCLFLLKAELSSKVLSPLFSLSPLELYYISFLLYTCSFISALKYPQESHITIKNMNNNNNFKKHVLCFYYAPTTVMSAHIFFTNPMSLNYYEENYCCEEAEALGSSNNLPKTT